MKSILKSAAKDTDDEFPIPELPSLNNFYRKMIVYSGVKGKIIRKFKRK